MAQYYYARGGQQQGPVSLQQLQQMADSGQLQAGDLVWTDGMANWAAAETVAGLSDRFGYGVAAEPPMAGGAQAGRVGLAGAPPVAHPRMGVLGYQTPDAYYPADLKPVSFGVFCGLFVGGIVAMFMAAVAVGIAGDDEPSAVALLLMFAAIGALIAGWIYGLVILYRAWKLIPPQYARTTPGKAVGFLFIPLFNLYWIFQAYAGLAKDYNASVTPRDPHAPAISESVGTMLPVMMLLSNIPVLGGIFGIVCIVLACIFIKQLAGAINHTCQRRAG